MNTPRQSGEAQPLAIAATDFDDPRSCDDFLALLDHYMQSPTGNGEPMSDELRQRLPAELRRRPQVLSYIAYRVSDTGQRAVGLINCVEGFSTFAGRPLLNVHDIVVHEDFRRQGIARALLAHVEAMARQRQLLRSALGRAGQGCRLCPEVRGPRRDLAQLIAQREQQRAHRLHGLSQGVRNRGQGSWEVSRNRTGEVPAGRRVERVDHAVPSLAAPRRGEGRHGDGTEQHGPAEHCTRHGEQRQRSGAGELASQQPRRGDEHHRASESGRKCRAGDVDPRARGRAFVPLLSAARFLHSISIALGQRGV